MNYCHRLKFTVILCSISLSFTGCDGIWSWLFSTTSQPKVATIIEPAGSALGKLVSVPFEMRTADEKFILEAQKYGLQLSDLDLCHHQVIMRLKKSCGSLTEEDIGKLSVALLNCQSSVEGRPTFSCIEGMSLRECTQDMDQNTWNSYHIVSNRARAVCYAARQQQFTAKTEMTVNKLVFTAEHQLDSLKKLEEGQTKVADITNKTLSTMATGQQDLMVRQERLKLSQQEIHSFVSGNLRELTREKRLIAAGQKELADMTEAIKQKLDRASQNLQKNEEERQNNHKEILQDLQTVHAKAKDVWEKLENSTERILQQHSETANHYRETLESFKRINDSINYLMNLLDQTRREVDVKLGWLTSLMGGAGNQLQVIYSLILHGAYFVTGAIVAAFMQVPTLTRAMLLVLVSGNAFLEVKHFACLDFAQMTAILLATLIGHWVINATLAKMRAAKPRSLDSKEPLLRLATCSNRTSTPIKKNGMTQASNEAKCFSNAALSQDNDSPNIGEELSGQSFINDYQSGANDEMLPTPQTATANLYKNDSRTTSFREKGNVRTAKKDLMSLGLLDVSSRTLDGSRSSTPTRRTSSSSKNYCNGLSKTGAPCRAALADGKHYCHRHIYQEES